MQTTNDSRLMELIHELRNIRDESHLADVVERLNKLDGISEEMLDRIKVINVLMHQLAIKK